MADKVLGLLEKFIQMLGADSCSDDFKLGLLATLKYLLENLCYYQSEVCGRQKFYRSAAQLSIRTRCVFRRQVSHESTKLQKQ